MDLDTQTDEQLVEIVRTKNQELFSHIIRRYEKKLFHYLHKFSRDKDEIEDILQSVFIKSFRNLNSFDTNKKFSSWIYRITHNEAINHIKKNSKQVSLDEIEFEIIDEQIGVDKRMDQDFDRNIVEKALSKIKGKYRDPLILYYFEQLSYEEIGQVLKIPKSTVGTNIKRGKESLLKILSN